jgi:DNA-binding IclR family transcriptional regulator
LIGTQYEARTPHTLTELAPLLAELAAIRRSRIAFDREEHTLGICAAGVALLDPLGNPVAISVPVPTPRFKSRQTMIVDRLLAARRALQAQIDAKAA